MPVTRNEYSFNFVLQTVGKGAKGDKGDPGAGGNFTAYAGEGLGGNRAVYIAEGLVYYVSATTIAHAGKCVGITTGAASLGASVEIQPSSSMTEPSWSWDVSIPIYIGTNGMLTQTVPTSGFIQVVAIPIATNSIVIQISDVYIRS